MGPSIILDKSVVQSMSEGSSLELGRYFWTNITPLLALEILGDLKKFGDNKRRAVGTIRALADRAQPFDSFANVDAEIACIASLLGHDVHMNRVPLVAEAYGVRTKSGQLGAYMPQDPVSWALVRWQCGYFAETEAVFADDWRRINRGLDLEDLKRRLGPVQVRLGGLGPLRETVDVMLADIDLQETLLDWFLEQLAAIPEVTRWTKHRWRVGDYGFIRQFAPYAHHCLRVELFFSVGLQHSLIGTRATNRLDMRYYWYTPFAQVFSSRDGLHKDLSPFLLDSDQTFADGDELVAELRSLAEHRFAAEAPADDDIREACPTVQPESGSLVHRLWEAHVPGGFRPQYLPKEGRISPVDELPDHVKEFFEATKEVDTKVPPQPRWPV